MNDELEGLRRERDQARAELADEKSRHGDLSHRVTVKTGWELDERAA